MQSQFKFLGKKFRLFCCIEYLPLVVIGSGRSQVANISLFLLLEGTVTNCMVSYDPLLPVIVELFSLLVSPMSLTQNPPSIVNLLKVTVFAPKLEDSLILKGPDRIHSKTFLKNTWSQESTYQPRNKISYSENRHVSLESEWTSSWMWFYEVTCNDMKMAHLLFIPAFFFSWQWICTFVVSLQEKKTSRSVPVTEIAFDWTVLCSRLISKIS